MLPRRTVTTGSTALSTVLWTVALLAVALLLAPAARADQRLVQVEPGNGASVESVPAQLVLTFAEPLDGAAVEVSLSTPSGEADVRAQVDGSTVTVPITDAGPGLYEVRYGVTPGEASGSTGFTVLAEGEAAPEQGQSSAWWLVGAALLVAGLGYAVAGTIRTWRRQ